MTMDLNKEAKIWCAKHSNKGCNDNCSGCWQLKQEWGCEQHNMESAYIAGSLNAINRIWHKAVNEPRRGRYIVIKQKDASVGEVFIAKALSNGEYIYDDSISKMLLTDIWCYLYDLLPNTK